MWLRRERSESCHGRGCKAEDSRLGKNLGFKLACDHVNTSVTGRGCTEWPQEQAEVRCAYTNSLLCSDGEQKPCMYIDDTSSQGCFAGPSPFKDPFLLCYETAKRLANMEVTGAASVCRPACSHLVEPWARSAWSTRAAMARVGGSRCVMAAALSCLDEIS
jgi:hypothetical protein